MQIIGTILALGRVRKLKKDRALLRQLRSETAQKSVDRCGTAA